MRKQNKGVLAFKRFSAVPTSKTLFQKAQEGIIYHPLFYFFLFSLLTLLKNIPGGNTTRSIFLFRVNFILVTLRPVNVVFI